MKKKLKALKVTIPAKYRLGLRLTTLSKAGLSDDRVAVLMLVRAMRVEQRARIKALTYYKKRG